MSNIYFTSDWHFYHKRIQEFCPHSRKGSTPEQMTEMIIENISAQTRPGDVIYNLGDVSFGTYDQTFAELTKIKKMDVQHHLVLGNHDRRIAHDKGLQALFTTVSQFKTISINKQLIVLCHYAMAAWDKKHYGSVMLHGHSHGDLQLPGKIMDVGIDTRPCGDMTLWPYEEIVEIMTHELIGQHH